MLKMIREDVSQSNVEWEWDEQTETLKVRKRKPDKNKAPFFDDLLSLTSERVKEIALPLAAPVVIMGDRSGSMDVAIRTSTIIAALLTALTKAKLVMFNTKNHDMETPADLGAVLETALSVEADAATSPAASLYPFYEKKEIVKTFIVVTDEEENEKFENYSYVIVLFCIKNYKNIY